jgi:4-hydroxy-2-oxoheptanedioate aldolase
MRTNKTKEKLQSGGTVFGCLVRYPDAGIVELLGYQGWDFLVFDGEHGTIQPRHCENMVRAAELRAVTPIIRVTTNQPPIILRFMDTGAQGLHVPWVCSAADAEMAVRSVKYHPRGIRGLANMRAADYGQTIPLSRYIEQANAETLTVIQIETADGVEHAREIAAVDGVDVIFVGATDLSHSLGVPAQFQHPTVLAAIQRLADVANRSNVALGAIASDAQTAREWIDRGARYILVSLESLVKSAAQQFLEKLK